MQRAAVIDAYARSISTIWLVMTPIVGASFVMGALLSFWQVSLFSDAELVLFVRQYSLKRTVIREGDQDKGKTSADLEKGAVKEEMKQAPTAEPTLSSELAIGEGDDANTIDEKYSIEKINIDNSARDYIPELASERPTTSSTMVEKDSAV